MTKGWKRGTAGWGKRDLFCVWPKASTDHPIPMLLKRTTGHRLVRGETIGPRIPAEAKPPII